MLFVSHRIGASYLCGRVYHLDSRAAETPLVYPSSISINLIVVPKRIYHGLCGLSTKLCRPTTISHIYLRLIQLSADEEEVQGKSWLQECLVENRKIKPCTKPKCALLKIKCFLSNMGYTNADFEANGCYRQQCAFVAFSSKIAVSFMYISMTGIGMKHS